MRALLLLPFVVQAAAIVVDEGAFHRRRGLPRWERIGHPLDTLTMTACYAWLLLARPSTTSGLGFVALAAFSCLFVTKDELVHARRCSPAEHWTHAVLFVIHPVVLAVAAFAWWTHDPAARALLGFQLAATAAFAAYQTLYWNGPWRRTA